MVSFETKIEWRKIKLLDYVWLLGDFGKSIIQKHHFDLPEFSKRGLWPPLIFLSAKGHN
jgi:hypothetical protein